MAWTEERVAVLSKLWAEGLSASQIAKQLGGVTRNAVIGKVHRLGLSGRAKSNKTAQRAPRRANTKPHTARIRVSPQTPATREPAKPVRPIPVEAKPLPNGEYASIMTITDHMCKWPIGDPSKSNFRFCGRASESGETYCKAHSQLAYQPSRRRGAAPRNLGFQKRRNIS